MKLKDVLEPFLSREERGLLVGSFDIVGDIAIIIIPPELTAKEGLIAEAIFKIHKNVKTVAKRAGIYEGEYRTIPLEVIGGEPLREVEHRENGVRFFLDPGRVYYSVRSVNERMRISRLVAPGEQILVMFSGIGAFPLVIALNSEAGEIVGIEKNPVAHHFAKKSLRANRRIKNVSLYEGDVAQVLPLLSRTFDRVLMPLPSTAGDFLDCALAAVKPGGLLHFYDFQGKDDFSLAVAKLQKACAENNRSLLRSAVVVCGHVSPGSYRVCVDAVIQ
jgi:tRNA (guanine37-N1)-methyltransferase